MTTKEQNQNEIEVVAVVGAARPPRKSADTALAGVAGAVERISDPRFYEVFYLLRPGLSEEELRAAENEVRTGLNDLNGIVIEEHAATAKGLAFPLGKLTEGNRGWVKFMLKPGELAPFRTRLAKIKEIVRLRVVSTTKENQSLRRAPTRRSEEKVEVKTDELDKKLEEILG
jgi:ribosomal protein S6